MDVDRLLRQCRHLVARFRTPRLRNTCIFVAVAAVLFMILTYGRVVDSLPLAATSSPLGDARRFIKEKQTYGDLSLPDAPFVGWPLARLCQDETAWTPGVIFMCNNNSGGIGNIRNFLLTCLRYAIEAGATGLVLPRIETRSATDVADLFSGQQPFDYFFDTEHFRRGLSQACPSLVLYDRAEDIPNLADKRPEELLPKAMGARGGCDYRDLNRHTDMFRARFDAWLAQSATDYNLPAVSELHPRLVQPVWGVQWEWPVAKDGPEFTNSVGGLLRFRQDILDMGRQVVAAMRRLAAADSKTSAGGPFAGVHLRTESDALGFWPTFETQSAQFLSTLAAKGCSHVYLATGNATEAAKFHGKSMESGLDLRIVDKEELLRHQPQLLQQLQSMTWDQQALVDFVVLVSCDYFLGVSPSSFSMTIAAKRHLATDGIYTRPWKVNDQGTARSRLVGNYTSHWDDWLFMYDSLWP